MEIAMVNQATDFPATLQDAHEGVQFFLEGVRKLPGVQRVEVLGGRSPSEPSLVVYVPAGDLEAERRVYSLEAAAYRQYPSLRLDVWVEETEIEAPIAASAPPDEI
jgi:hypothetical protein